MPANPNIMTLPVDTLLQGGKYRIVRFISSGGFGCTYEAIHVNMEERVAIKEFFVKDFCNRDETTAHITVGTVGKRALVDKLRRKFADEARALYKLKHPGIVRVSDVFEENGTAYYVMDYVDGLSLGEIVKRDGAMPEVRAVRYIRQVAEALRYVHDHNRLHLDIKPGNIMVDSDDNAILIDFGASKQYDEEAGENTSTLMGKTPGYAPLEQMGNDVVKFLPATDIYALGATLYKLLTGVTPLSANVLANGEELAPLPSAISAATRNAIAAAMDIKSRRPQTIDAFLALLDGEPAPAAVSDETVFDNDATVVDATEQAPQPKPQPAAKPKPYKSVLPSEPKRSFFGRHKWLTAAACIAVFAVIGFVILRVIGSDDTPELISVSPATGSIDGHDYVDMGLSVMWSTCNVGATSPWEYGDYFAWGETKPKEEYTEENSKTNNKNIGDIAGNPKYDAARANWGGQWRMPTQAEMQELIDNCTWTWTTFAGYVGDYYYSAATWGYVVTSNINGNSIFLPAAGGRRESTLEDAGEYGLYWSSTSNESMIEAAFGFSLDNDGPGTSWSYRYAGFSVRPVYGFNSEDSTAAAEQARQAEEKRKQEEAAQKQRDQELAAQKQREEELAAQKQREEELAAQQAAEQARLAEEKRRQERLAPYHAIMMAESLQLVASKKNETKSDGEYYGPDWDHDYTKTALYMDLGDSFKRYKFVIMMDYYTEIENSQYLLSLSSGYRIFNISLKNGVITISINNGDKFYDTGIAYNINQWESLFIGYDNGQLYINDKKISIDGMNMNNGDNVISSIWFAGGKVFNGKIKNFKVYN